MYCKKCGNDIGTKEKCLFCGAEQHSIDPFTTLGDIEPNKSCGRTRAYVNNPVTSSTEPDYFSALGDLRQSDDYFGEAQRANADSEINSIDPFQPMGNLDGSPSFLDDSGMDEPAAGGFKPMDVLPCAETGQTADTPPANTGDKPATGGFKRMGLVGGTKGRASVTIDGTKEKKHEISAKTFEWKRWMIVIPTACILLLLVMLGFAKKTTAGKTDILMSTIESYIQNEITDATTLPLMFQYQNEVLKAISYDIQSYDLATGTMDVKFTYIDVLSLADSITDPQITEDQYYNSCIERILSGEYKRINEVIKVHFESKDDGYSIIRSDDLINVLSGGTFNYYLELLEEGQYE